MKKITGIFLVLIMFIQYLGVGFYAHIIILLILFLWMLKKGTPMTFSYLDLFLFLFLGIISVIKSMGISALDNVLLFKFYWGFILFYIFFKYSGYKLDYRLLFILVCGVTIVDFVLINTIVPVGMMKNVPGGELNISAAEKIGGFYRSYGLGSSPTVSATIIVVLLACCYYRQRELFKNRYILYTILPLVFLGSGTGFFLFFLFLFFKYRLYRGWKLIIGILFILILLYIMLLMMENENTGLLSKMSLVYLTYLVSFKTEQIMTVVDLLNKSVLEFLFGHNYSVGEGLRIMSDFGWLDMLEAYGYFGVILLCCYILFKKKLLYIPVLLFLIGAFHYPALFSIPGQLILGSLLVNSDEK